MAKEKERMFMCRFTPKKSFSFFEDMRRKKELCDITFQVGDESIFAHRIIVAAVIPHLRDILLNKYAQEEEEGISIPGVKPEAFKCLIEFAYNCKLKIDMKNVTDLLSASCYLRIDEVRESCCDFLANNLEPETVLSVRELAINLKCSELLEDVDCYIRQNFLEISEAKQFLNWPVLLLKDIISKSDLYVNSEEKIIQAVVRWVKESIDDRKSELPELLSKIRMSQIEPLYLAHLVEREEIIRTSISCRDLIDEAKHYNLLPQMKKDICSFSKEPRQFAKRNSLIQKDDEECIYKLESKVIYTVGYFDLKEEKWHTNLESSYCVDEGAATELHSKIYYFDKDTSLRYDPTNNSYEFLDHMETARSYTSAICLGGMIYVFGGKVGFTACNIVESFDPAKDKWATKGTMRTALWATSLAALGEYIYVLGGEDECSTYDCVERYDPVRDKWRTLSPMLTERSFAGAAVLNGKIYVCGGTTLPSETGVTSTSEMYDPITNKWKFISPMKSERFNFKLLSCRGKLYALGGSDANDKFVCNFDVYDPESDEWTSSFSADSDYHASGAVVMATTKI